MDWDHDVRPAYGIGDYLMERRLKQRPAYAPTTTTAVPDLRPDLQRLQMEVWLFRHVLESRDESLAALRAQIAELRAELDALKQEKR